MREEARQIREARRAKMTQAEREKEDLDEALFLLNWGTLIMQTLSTG
jgi:hypothetical protein